MKKLRSSSRIPLNKKIACTVSAAALMLGVSSAATVGLHFQDNYCASAPYTGFVVTMPAFGIDTNGWENLLPTDTGYGCMPAQAGYTNNEVIDSTTSTNGLNPLANGSIDVNWFAPTANFSGFAGYAGSPPQYAYNGHYPGGIPINGDEEVYSTFLRDGFNFGPVSTGPGTVGGAPGGVNDQPGYLIDVTGLKTLFTNSPFVVELIAAADSVQSFTNAYVVDVSDSITDSVTYPSTPPVTDDEGGQPWVRGHLGGLSTVTGVFGTNADHIQIFSNQPLGGGDKTDGFDHGGTIAGFIITDKPVVTMSPQPVPVAGPGDTIVLNPYVIGVPPLTYQWRNNGVAIPGATNVTYTISNVGLGSGGSFDLVVTNLYGSATSLVSSVTVDQVIQTPAADLVLDSNPANPQNNGVDMGATWEASESDGTITRNGVMSFVAADTNGITVTDSPGLDASTGTISFWMQSSGTDTSASGTVGAALVCRPTGSAGNDFVLVQNDPPADDLYFQGPNSSGNFFNTGLAVSDGKWHFVTLTFDQSATGAVGVYVDGVLDSSDANGGSWSWTAGQPFEIGYSSDPNWRAYNGLLSDVRYYNSILTAGQITAIYTTGGLAPTNNLHMAFEFASAPGNGFVLTWLESSAVLQSAPALGGPWSDLTGAASPYTIVPTANQQFFRYRYKTQSLMSNPYLM